MGTTGKTGLYGALLIAAMPLASCQHVPGDVAGATASASGVPAFRGGAVANNDGKESVLRIADRHNSGIISRRLRSADGSEERCRCGATRCLGPVASIRP